MQISKRLTGFLIYAILIFINTHAQNTDTLKGRNLYRPYKPEMCDTVVSQDTLAIQRLRDSLEMRIKFIQDSILAREQFVRDSILRRQRILDSVTVLQKELNILLEAYFRTVKEEILLRGNKIPLVGDSALGDFVGTILPFTTTEPYTPWKVIWQLTGKGIRINIDKNGKNISVYTPQIKALFSYADAGNLLIINESAAILKNSTGSFYTMPVDSVFFDRYKRVVKIKRYVQYYSLLNNTRGNFLFVNCKEIKQYEYAEGNEITKYELVKFCERSNTFEAGKVCSIISYFLTKQNNVYMLVRKNNPANSYSDGTYKYIYDLNGNLTNISFINTANTENWERNIELNKEGWVSCYFDKKNDVIVQSLCMIYHTNDPGAKYPLEIITTTFESDGISYYQRNNTTGLVRTRDKMTLEWTPWR